MNIYFAVDKKVPDAENVSLSGQFFSKAYEGPYKETKNWMKDYNASVAAHRLKIKKLYIWYTTCPKCAKKYGKNYTVVIGQME